MSTAIHRFFTQRVIMQRLKVTDGRKKTFQSTATVDGHIQALDKAARQKLGIIEARAWQAWFDIDEDWQEGDRAVDENGQHYLVSEVTKKNYGINEHLQIILLEESA